jgi:purine-binding chemotaxis protein CheW
MADNVTEKALAGQYLTFLLRGQIYAVSIGAIREINRVGEITPVPQAPSFVSGVINLRGKVIPVVDLRLKFGLPFTDFTRETCIVVIEVEHGQVGIIVDSVSGVVDFLDNQIEPPPYLGDTKSGNQFIRGMGKIEGANGKVCVILDIIKALGRDELSRLSSDLQTSAKTA